MLKINICIAFTILWKQCCCKSNIL